MVEQLQPAALKEACSAANAQLTLRYHAGCDHSYFFVATVAEEHLLWHAKAMGALL